MADSTAVLVDRAGSAMADVIAAAGTATAKDLLLERPELAGADMALGLAPCLPEAPATPTRVGSLPDLVTMVRWVARDLAGLATVTDGDTTDGSAVPEDGSVMATAMAGDVPEDGSVALVSSADSAWAGSAEDGLAIAATCIIRRLATPPTTKEPTPTYRAKPKTSRHSGASSNIGSSSMDAGKHYDPPQLRLRIFYCAIFKS